MTRRAKFAFTQHDKQKQNMPTQEPNQANRKGKQSKQNPAF